MSKAKPKQNLLNVFLKLRPVLRWVLKLRSSPKAIAGGLALGTFIAFTPTYGVQLFLAVLLATFLNLNRAAALVPVWITNPVTIAPIYTFNYWIGCFAWSGPPVREVYQIFLETAVKLAKLDFWDIQEQLIQLVQVGGDVLMPLTLGSVVVGAVCGAITYWGSMKLLLFFFQHRAKKRKLR